MGELTALSHLVLRLLADLLGLTALAIKPRQSIEAENLFLRRQLALYRELGVKPRRVDAATRIGLALLSTLFNWHSALVVVHPASSTQEAMVSAPSRDGFRTRQISSRDSSRALQFGQNKQHELGAVALDCLLTVEHAQHSPINREKS